MKPSDEINKLALYRKRNSKYESHEENIVRAIIMYLDEQYEKTTKRSKKPLRITPTK